MRLFLLVALTMTAFAANSILNRLALATGAADPAAFAAIRTLSGAAMLATLVVFRSGWPVIAGPRRVSGTLSLTAYMLGFSFAYVSLDAGLGALILFGGVQITMFAAAVAGAERVPPGRWVGAVLAFAGLAWIVWPTNASAPPPLYAGLMVVAAIGWGVYSLVGRKERDPLAATAANFICAAPIVLIVWAIIADEMTPLGIVLATTAGAITSGLGYTLWYAVLPRLERSVAAVAQLTVPVIALAAGAVFLGETVTLSLALASAVVLGGVALGALSPDHRKSGSSGS